MWDFDNLVLLSRLEEYIPYMLEEELFYIIFAGTLPSPESVTRWERERSAASGPVESRLREALLRQESRKNRRRGDNPAEGVKRK